MRLPFKPFPRLPLKERLCDGAPPRNVGTFCSAFMPPAWLVPMHSFLSSVTSRDFIVLIQLIMKWSDHVVQLGPRLDLRLSSTTGSTPPFPRRMFHAHLRASWVYRFAWALNGAMHSTRTRRVRKAPSYSRGRACSTIWGHTRAGALARRTEPRNRCVSFVWKSQARGVQEAIPYFQRSSFEWCVFSTPCIQYDNNRDVFSADR